MILKELNIRNASVCVALSLALSSMALANENASLIIVNDMPTVEEGMPTVEEHQIDENIQGDIQQANLEHMPIASMPTELDLAQHAALKAFEKHFDADANLEEARSFIIRGQSNPDLTEAQMAALDKLDSAITVREEVPELRAALEDAAKGFDSASTHEDFKQLLDNLMEIRFKQQTACKYVDGSHLVGADATTWNSFNIDLEKNISAAIAGIAKVAKDSGIEAGKAEGIESGKIVGIETGKAEGIKTGKVQGKDAQKKAWRNLVAKFVQTACNANEKDALHSSADSDINGLDSKQAGRCRIAVKNSLINNEHLPEVRKAIIESFFKFAEENEVSEEESAQ